MRLGALAFSIVALAALPTGVAHAGTGSIEAEAEDPGSPGDDPPPEETWVCTYSDVVVGGGTNRIEGEERFVYIDASYYRFNTATGEAWIRSYERCESSLGATSSGTTWRLISDPDPRLAVDPAYERVVETVRAPTPDLSPVGTGYVNLGMWLATVEPEPVVARAEAGESWAEVTATLRETTFDMGNGDVVTCAGAGDPIPDEARDDVDASSDCGYTYRDVESSGSVTIIATWTVSYLLSNGGSGTRADIVLTTSVPYEVREIQTVGVGG